MAQPETMSAKDYLAKQAKESVKHNSPEHDEQVKVFEWAKIMSNKIPALELLMAIPNGGQRHKAVAVRLMQEGVKSGVPDIFLPVPMEKYSLATQELEELFAGLWIEMKYGKNKQNENQLWWAEKLREMSYKVEVCYSAEDAIKIISDYLS